MNAPRLWLLFSAWIGVSASALAGGTSTTADGVYTRDQAKSGEDLYEVHCLTCHDKKYFRPVLKRWHGQPVSILFDVMAGSMPESNPGGLLDDEYLDILAYIFSRSRYPAADEPLVMGALPSITIEHQ
jgi:mono/diheme cytochrome c family protein